MPYREKIAWLYLVAMVVTFGPYFTLTAMSTDAGGAVPNLRQLGFFAATAIVQVVIIGIGHLLLRRAEPEDARIPPDERDLAIKRRAVSTAYHVLIGGMIVVGVVMPFNSVGWTLINAALFMIILAELVHYGVTVVGYRTQA